MRTTGRALLALAFALDATPGFCSPGDLDPSFGNHGRVVTDLGGIEFAKSAALQADGRIVVAGFTGAGKLLLVRYDSDGTLDASFGTGGTVLTTIGSGGGAGALALQTDGKMVAAGAASVGGSGRIAVARYDASGTLDPTFGSGGTVTTAVGDSANANAVVIQPDGSIVAAGYSTTAGHYDFALVRYDASGALDPTFGTGGIVATDLGVDALANAMVLQPDGRLIVGGFSASSPGNPSGEHFALARYAADGSLDPSFGSGGTIVAGFQGRIAALALVAGGKFLVAGKGYPGGFVLARYESNGNADATFGVSGIVTSRFGSGEPDDAGFALAVQPDGRIVVAGRGQPGYASPYFGLIRYDADGSLDRTFAPCVVVATPFPPVGTFGATAYAVLVQPDGKLVTVGTSNDEDVALARYVGTGSAPACEPAAARKAALRVRGQAGLLGNPRSSWRWTAAGAVMKADFGDPTTGTDYTFCVLDGAGTLQLAATTPADPCADDELCWRSTAADAYGYSTVPRVYGVPGLTRIALKAGAAGHATIRTLGGVDSFGVPSPPLTTPVVVRFQRDDAPKCWEATFTNPSTNDTRRFTAKSD